MKKARLFLVGVLMSGFIVVGAGPASANCQGDPNLPDPCVAICVVGQGNKYTEKLFSFCEVW
jgi:hypothetical protein